MSVQVRPWAPRKQQEAPLTKRDLRGGAFLFGAGLCTEGGRDCATVAHSMHPAETRHIPVAQRRLYRLTEFLTNRLWRGPELPSISRIIASAKGWATILRSARMLSKALLVDVVVRLNPLESNNVCVSPLA